MVLVVDNFAQCIVLNNASTKSRRVTSSVSAAELFEAAGGFNYRSMIREECNDRYGRTVRFDLWVDDNCLWDCIKGLKKTAEKRLLIYLETVRNAYEVREITNVYWFFLSDENSKNALNKRVFSHALQRMLTDNRFNLNPDACVEQQAKAQKREEKMLVARVETA